MSAVGAPTQRRGRNNRGEETVAVSIAEAVRRSDAAPIVTVYVPLEFRQRSGRKVLVAPGASQVPLRAPRPTNPTRDEVTPALRALARAFRWRRLLESGAVATVREIAAAENLNPSYVSRVLRLTLLAPEAVDTIIGSGSTIRPPDIGILLAPFPLEWRAQKFPFLSKCPLSTPVPDTTVGKPGA